MRITSLTLYSNDLESQKTFYQDVLGFEIFNESAESFSIQIGWSILTFKHSKEKYLYHYCFLIPSNKFDKAYDWFSERLDIIHLDQESTFDFESWNAKSFYFYDGNGNVAECIVRYDLKNNTLHDFSLSDLICVNEIGSPTFQIEETNKRLESITGSLFWKGNQIRFGTNGDNEGLFLLVNSQLKKDWFPTQMPTQSSPYLAEIETQKGIFEISYTDQKMNINRKS